MKTSRRKVLDRLERAQRRGRPVRIERDRVHDGDVRGFVAAVSDRWVAVELVHDNVHPDGLAFVRVKHVTRVRKDRDAGFVIRALRETGPTRAHVTLPQDARTRDVLRVAADRASVVGFYDEDRDASAYFVGRPTAVDEDGFDFRYISTGGRWNRSVERFEFREVSRLDVGARYLDALATYGDPVPEDA